MALQGIMEGHTFGGQQPLNPLEILGFAFSGAVATKCIMAPVDRVKLIYQCQEELIRHDRITRPYFNIAHCQVKTYQREGGHIGFWKGNMANLMRYIPTQTLMFAVKHTIGTDIAAQAKDCNKFQQSCMAGGIAGAVSLGALYPLDLARNRLTLDTYMRTTPHRLYDGLRDVYAKTWKAEGLTGLYRGLFVSLAGVVVYRGLFFGLYDHFKPQIFGDNVGWFASFLVGYGSTVVASSVAYPFDVIRRRYVIMSPDTERARSATACLIRIIRLEGLEALHKGIMANGMRCVGGGIVLASFDKLQIMYAKSKLEA